MMRGGFSDEGAEYHSLMKNVHLLKPTLLAQDGTGIIGGLNAFGDNYTIVSSPDSNTAVYWIYAQMKGNLYALTGAASMVLGLIVILASLPNFAKMVKDN